MSSEQKVTTPKENGERCFDSSVSPDQKVSTPKENGERCFKISVSPITGPDEQSVSSGFSVPSADKQNQSFSSEFGGQHATKRKRKSVFDRNSKRPKVEDMNPNETLYCICKLPARDLMIECEVCENWYHWDCQNS